MSRTRKSELTRNEILKFAEKRFAKHGVHKTSVEEIARDVRMGKASLYHHFPSKENLYIETLNYSLESLLSAVRIIFNNEETSFQVRFEQYLELRITFPEMFPLLHELLLKRITGSATNNEIDVFKEWISKESDLLFLFFSAHQLTDLILNRAEIVFLLLRLNGQAAAYRLFTEFITPLQIKESGLKEYRNLLKL